MLHNSLLHNRWKPSLLKKQALNINHLTFVDDIILFSQSTDDGLQKILNILHQFSLASRQRINFSMSHIIFHKKLQCSLEIMCALS